MNPLAYIKIAGAVLIAIALASGFAYVSHLKASRDAALVAVANLQATNNELNDVHRNDVKALAELEAAKAQSEAALIADAKQQQGVEHIVVQWKEKVAHVPVAATCRAADARDAATLDGVRNILAGAAAADSNSRRQDPAARGAAGGHSTSGPARPGAHP